MRLPTMILCLCAAIPASAETRKWTNSGGRIIEAEYLGTRDKSVVLKLKDGREVPVELGTLSAADQDYVKANVKAAPAGGIPAGKKGAGFKDVVLDKTGWVLRTEIDKFGITGVDLAKQFETPHFLFNASARMKQPIIDVHAETCERLYAHILRDLPGLETKFKEGRMAIWLSVDKEEHIRWGESLSALGADAGSWDGTTISALRFPQEFAQEHKILISGRGFDTSSETSGQRNMLWPQRIHFMTASMIGVMGYSYRTEGRSYGMFNLCYSYHTENVIAGKVESKVIFNSGFDAVEGFKNPRGWAAAVKRLLDSTPLKPGLKRFLELEAAEAEPMDLGSGFGMMQWIFNDPAKTSAINRMIGKSMKSRITPTPEEFAKEMGFTSVDAFDQAWTEFLKSDGFK